ncbi:cardiolipin synthase [Paenibacillus hemerocallicola]|uniref:Cardiolipin synthase n=1 Tax=Paenibacillus hemerocallicola TaxID=1172614 RepID=A0A5C4TDS5_9BACL|nr:cardiolipin synthase [Paenibacillus hemerocallicola]TNJ66786.1 cardiolipin synthase [Paenibacillus hemerocallicola]
MMWLSIALGLILFQIATILVSEFRNPAKAVAWLSILFIFPIIGFVMYYFLAKEYTQRKKMRRKDRRVVEEIGRALRMKARKADPGDAIRRCDIFREHRLLGLLSNIPGSPMMACNKVEVYNNADDTYTAMLRAMENARSFIHIESYIVRNDSIGERFKKMMIRKAAEGVSIRLMFDGVGSYQLSGRYVEELKRAGVEVHSFLPPLIAFFDKRINYRNHRKIVVVDGKIGFLGGINIGDEYLGADPVLGYWRDSHMRLEGDSVYYLQHTFAADWAFASGKQLIDPKYFPEHDCSGEETVQLIASGPDAPWDTVLEVFFGAMAVARRRIYITTPYFIPDPSIGMALKTAAVSGVDVRIILPGVPDARIVHWASLSYVQELMQAGVRFYQYQKGFVHAKTLIIDRILATVGTANMDMRSFFNNFEIMAVLYDRSTILRVEQDFMADMKNSKEINPDEFEKRSKYQRAKEAAARMLAPLF